MQQGLQPLAGIRKTRPPPEEQKSMVHSPSHSTPVKCSNVWTRRSLVGALDLGGAAALGVPLYNAFGMPKMLARTQQKTFCWDQVACC